MTIINSHPHYHEGWDDALEGEPLFDDATDEYKAGWRAFHYVKEGLQRLSANNAPEPTRARSGA